ncbi:dual specificity protein phosphatase 1-like [Phalaenopsis equestris]|uniref:dual specificity protein phosphatase 1-like n=1 Tax=Phalaenopsis equestris TaxID=78828 RepID=UPI0009E615F0|nr:dual specificity protein phosphatase 1-like [Phalaenopsis equestris]XP_020586851.1 dual specificity protein phosphatase 1-like [Phalaenopsis equestris]
MSSQDDVQRKKIATFLQALCAAKYVREDNVPCQIEEGLFLGSVGVACNKEALKSLKITHVLIVANSLEPAFPDDFIYKKIEVLDTPITNITKHFQECFDFIDEARQAGGGALVHCFAGRSRSVTVTIAYLMKEHQMSFSQAFSLVKSKRPLVAPNSGFMAQLQNYEKSLRELVNKVPEQIHS